MCTAFINVELFAMEIRLKKVLRSGVSKANLPKVSAYEVE